MGDAHSANLGTTAEIHSAIRAAQLCQQGMTFGWKHTRLLSEPLPALPGQGSARTQVIVMQLSPDGRQAAVFFGASFATLPKMGIAIYALDTGKILSHWISRVGGLDDHSWSPCSTYLRLQHDNLESPCIEVHVPATGQVVTPAWSSEAAAVLSQKGDCAWSPDGNLLLYSLKAVGQEQALHVVHLVRGTLLASVKLQGHACSLSKCPANRESSHALWHPSSKGLILPGCSWTVVDPQPLYSIGLKVGYCPVPAHMSLMTASFSPCGKYLLAKGEPPAISSKYPSFNGAASGHRFCVLRCRDRPHDYSLKIQYTWGPREPPLLCRWCPMSPALLRHLKSQGAVLVSNENVVQPAAPDGVYLGESTPPGFRLGAVPQFSPCGQFCCVLSNAFGMSGTSIWHTRNGECYEVSPDAQDLLWPSSGDCIVQWNAPWAVGGAGKCPFSVLRYKEPKHKTTKAKGQ